ncbi:uncharacterized protein cenpt isoform X2 [Trichomycterus rosablanca]|uniref:uncharacterized protein cenpt isoform X2 n=1 Tax=Trichomycterus rosablanca TaxID=2290929 RepID=UPI002F36073E
MDSVEDDVSARVLLKNVLHAETQRSPVTSSVSQDQPISRPRRSSRIRKTPGLESPQLNLRHKLKQKLHESATQSPLPSKRARLKGKAVKTPAVTASLLYDEDMTPRGLLKNIIQTETEASLLLSGQPGLLENNQEDVEASTSNRLSEGGSGLELPDLVTEPLSHIIRGMSRRRPPPIFNVSAFERKLDSQSDEGEDNTSEDVNRENTYMAKEHDLSDGSKSVLSLTLKTPFVSICSERAGLQRKAARRKQPSVDAFDEAVQNHLERHGNQILQDGKSLGDSEWHKFTLGLSNISVPELTTDIVMSNTELYAHPPGSVSELKEDMSRIAMMGAHENDRVYDVERKRDSKIVGDKYHDEQNVSLGNISKTQPEPSHQQEDPKPAFESDEEIERIPSSQEEGSLSPEEIPLAPTQPMINCVPQRLEKEAQKSVLQEPEIDGMESREDESHPEEELVSQISRRVTRRAYNSEGEANMLRLTARGRATKSLGERLDPVENEITREEPDMEDLELKGDVSPPKEYTSSRRISRRACSEGGTRKLEVIAKGRGTKSLGTVLHLTEKEISSDQEETEYKEGESVPNEELSSQISRRISQRSYNSDAGEKRRRGTNSLGAELDSTEKEISRAGLEMEEPEFREDESLANQDLTSQPSRQITRRAYNSEGRAVKPGVIHLRGTKSLGAGLDPTEKDLQSYAGGSDAEECATLDEEPHLSPALLSTFNSIKSCSPGSHQSSLASVENYDINDDAIATPVHLNPTMSPQCPEAEDEEGEFSDELNMKTPAFIRQRKQVATPGALATPTVLKDLNTGHVPQVVRPRRKQKLQSVSDNVLPKSYIMNVFKHFAKTKVASDVYPIINEILQKYFDRLADDLEAYSAHARRKTIEVEDVELLMRRQGFVTDSTPVNVLIEKFLPLEYRKLLIPVATSGNKVIPDTRR